MFHQTISPAPSLLDSMQRASRQLTVPEQRELATWLAKELCARDQIGLIRSLGEELSFSYGTDDLEKGCVIIESDLDAEEVVARDGIPSIPMINTTIRQLNPEAWS